MDGAAAACRRSLRAALVCLVLAALVAGAQAAPAHAQAPAERYGVNLGGVLDLPPEARDRHLAAMAAGGLRVGRVDASWSGAEPQAPEPSTGERRYRWEGNDRIAGSLARHGIRWYPLLAYSTGWAARVPGDLMSPPADPAQFAAYARAFAARYGPDGAFWAEHPALPRVPVAAYEVWNEPNAEMFWRGQATAPEDYADLFLAARRAIREVDTATPVVTGGLLDANATDPSLFVRRMVRHRPELVGEIDAVGYHPYQQAYGPIVGGIQELRSTMRSVGLGAVPIEISEVGATTAWVPEADRAQLLGRLAREMAANDLGVTRLLPYTWLGSERAEQAAPRPEDFAHFWGMVRRDGTPLPTATAYLAAVRDATAAPPRALPRSAPGEPAAGDAAGAPAGPRAAAAPAKAKAAKKRPLTKKQRRRIARRLLARKRRLARRLLRRKATERRAARRSGRPGRRVAA
jgi:hypothetical protein